uniref:outer membrane beta-barrel protein n=1 Tax=Pedobacter schmidteae TaxID=2201271 RepID=UPI001D01F9F7|nr:outer membrane beta-barrel protein [Pedobacter schmidteae]
MKSCMRLMMLLTGGLMMLTSNSIFAQQDSIKTLANPKGEFVGGITFTRFDLGFTRLVDNGSFSLSPVNDFLGYKEFKSSTVSFDVLDYGYRFNSNFKVYLAAGLDWTMLRLKRDITIKRNTPVLEYEPETGVVFSKNRFSSFYVHVPLGIQFRTNENQRGKRFYFVVGPELGFLINGKVKQVSKENGKQKFRDDYNFEKVRLGGTLRVGYGWIGLFSKYYFTDMFDSAPQTGLKNMSFGITLGLN